MSPPSDVLGPLARRPAVSLAVLLATGILLHDRLPSHPWLTVVAAATLAAAAAACLSRRFVASGLLAAVVVLCGAGLAQREHYRYAAADVGAFATDGQRLATVEATIADEPRLTAGADNGRPLPPRQTFLADVTRVLTTHGWVPAGGQLPVRLNQPSPTLAAGQTVQLLGQLERPRPAGNPGEFDWAVYYRRLRVTATLTVNRAGNAHVLAQPGVAPLSWVRGRVRHLLAAGFGPGRSADFAVLQAVLLGDHDPQLQDAAADFEQTGVAYQLSASGLHVALLAGGLVWACRRARLRPRWTLAVGVAFAAAFAAVATPSHSGWRSVCVSAVLAAGLAWRRTADRPQLIAIAMIAMLVYHPLDLYTPGFQLSLAVVVAFLVLLPAVRRWWVDPDRLRREPRRLTVLGHALKWAGVTAQYAVVAWLATLPLAAVHFGRLTPWVVLADVAVYPFVVLALYAGAAKVLLTLLWPSLGHPLAVLASWPVVAMRGVVHVAAQLPGGTVPVSAPPAWAVVLFYAVLLVPLIPVPKGRWRWPVRLSPSLGLAGLLAVSLGSTSTAAAPVAAAGPALRVTLLSIGAGQACVVELPGGHAVVFDAGSSTVPDVADRVVVPFLRSRGVRHLDDVFLSHGDFDHIGAAGELAATFSPDAVFTSRHFRRHAFGNEPALDLLAKLDELRLPPRELATGDGVDLGAARVDVLWPPAGGLWTSNDAGLVLRLTYAGRRILFPADIQDPAFAGLLRHPGQLAADVLVAPHHGSSEPLTPAFLAAVRPSVIVSSNAARLTAKQRRFGQMAAGTPLYRTPACGAITVTVTADGRVAVSTYLHPAAAAR